MFNSLHKPVAHDHKATLTVASFVHVWAHSWPISRCSLKSQVASTDWCKGKKLGNLLSHVNRNERANSSPPTVAGSSAKQSAGALSDQRYRQFRILTRLFGRPIRLGDMQRSLSVHPFCRIQIDRAERTGWIPPFGTFWTWRAFGTSRQLADHVTAPINCDRPAR